MRENESLGVWEDSFSLIAGELVLYPVHTKHEK